MFFKLFCKFLITTTLYLLFLLPSFAHMCHDPFRPREHLVIIPEKETISIENTAEFRMYIENTFNSTLRDVRLFIKSDAFDIDIKPSVLEKLSPGERTFFIIILKLRKGIKPGNYPLKINVQASSAELKPAIEKISVSVSEAIAKSEKEFVIKDRLSDKDSTEPKEKNIISQNLDVEELPIKETKTSQEEIAKPQDVVEVTMKVEKISFWRKPYFYLILVFSFLIILIWRKLS